MPPPLPALLPNQEPRGADLHARGVFRGVHGRIDLIQEGRLARGPGLAEDVQRRLARPRERTNDDEVERREGPRAGRPRGEVGPEGLRLRYALGRETGVVEVEVGRVLSRSGYEALVRPRLLRGDVVVPLGVADEVHLLRAVGEKHGEAGLGRAEGVLEAVALHGVEGAGARTLFQTQEASRHCSTTFSDVVNG